MNIVKTLTENRIANIPGFKRVPKYDFSDDGSRFTAWVYKGIPMTQCRGGGNTYLCLRTDYISSFKKDGLSDLEFHLPWQFWYDNKGKDVEDVFNGVPEFDLDQLLKNVDILIEQIKTVTEKFNNLNEIDFFPIEERCWEESKVLKEFLESARTEFQWMSASDYDTKRFKDYWKSLKNYADRAHNRAFAYRLGEVSKYDLYEDNERLKKYGYVITEVDGSSFYMKEIKEMIKNSIEAAKAEEKKGEVA